MNTLAGQGAGWKEGNEKEAGFRVTCCLGVGASTSSVPISNTDTNYKYQFPNKAIPWREVTILWREFFYYL